MSARVKKRERDIERERESCLSRTRGFSLLLVFTKKKKKKKKKKKNEE
jgi:hypothetical protein